MLGEYDRQVVSRTRTSPSVLSALAGARSPATWHHLSTQRTRVLSPGEIANIPAGRALHLDGVQWELVTLTPHTGEPWRTLTTASARRAMPRSRAPSRIGTPGSAGGDVLGRLEGSSTQCVECVPVDPVGSGRGGVGGWC
jgi:hypothetical protein